MTRAATYDNYPGSPDLTDYPDSEAVQLTEPFRLGGIDILPLQNALVGDGNTVTVEPRIMSVLCVLAAHGQDVVTRDLLIAAVWGDDAVADDSVNQAISVLRKALQQAGGPQAYIKTVPKRGYRMAVWVESAGDGVLRQSIAAPGSNVRHRTFVFGVAGLLLAAVALWFFGVGLPQSDDSEPTQSVAVLPFTAISNNTDDAIFAAGMHEALLTSLQKVRSLRVTSRTSSLQFADSALSVPEIASSLGVSWVVEGTVLRDGDRFRISAKLIDGVRDTPVWAEQYERRTEEMLSLQNTVAKAVARAVHIELSDDEQARLTDEITVNPQAYSAYIRGLHHFDRITPADFERSVVYFREAIALAPEFPLPHAALVVAHGIAVEYGWRTRDETRDTVELAARTASRLGPDMGESHHALASFAFHYDRDFDTAEREFQRAIDLNHDAYTYFSYGWLLSQLGRHDEAVQALEQAVDLNPRSAAMHTDLGWWLYGGRHYAQAIQQAEVALDIFPNHPEAYWLLAAAYAATGQHADAQNAFDQYEALYGSPVHWFRGYLQGVSDNTEAALRTATLLEHQIKDSEALPIDAALIHIALGDTASALSIIEQSQEASVSFQPYLWPEYESLWHEPRFQPVLERFGLPLPPKSAH